MDTISLRVTGKEKFRVANWAIFSDDFKIREFSDLSKNERIRAADKRFHHIKKYTLQPKTIEGFYAASVEIYERADVNLETLEYELVVRVSIPKLIFENNLEEISYTDHHKITNALSEHLLKIGIGVSTYVINSAIPSVLHLGKNIILPPSIIFRLISAELSHTDMGKAYETTSDKISRDKNNSEVVHLRHGTREWSFYDKIDEIKNSKGKKTLREKELIEIYNLIKTEVFRYEYRLNKTQTIRSEVNKLLGRDYKTPVTFADLFSENLWKKMILISWQKIIERPENQMALLKVKTDLDLFMSILKKADEKDKVGHSQNQALWSAALALLIKKFGAKTVKKELSKVWSTKADERLDEKLEIAAGFVNNLPFTDGIAYISKELEKFELITLASLEKPI